MNNREAILSGIKHATLLHQHLRSESEVAKTAGSIDVFDALVRSGASVLFRPLEGLLGACISKPGLGVIISTRRPLAVQRFTGAHELGHVYLHHELSLDGEEILQRNEDGLGMLEIQANAFASEFLMPKWLISFHARRQNWDRSSLSDPLVVYQLSLRLGASYHATCVSLRTNKLIDSETNDRLIAIPRKKIKQSLLAGIQLDHWNRDVWLLTALDKDCHLQGQPDDLFLIRLSEQSSAGYLWDIHDLRRNGFSVLREDRKHPPCQLIGGSVEREIVAASETAHKGAFLIEQRRPWKPAAAPLNRLQVWYDLQGREEGLPRAVRAQMLAV